MRILRFVLPLVIGVAPFCAWAQETQPTPADIPGYESTAPYHPSSLPYARNDPSDPNAGAVQSLGTVPASDVVAGPTSNGDDSPQPTRERPSATTVTQEALPQVDAGTAAAALPSMPSADQAATGEAPPPHDVAAGEPQISVAIPAPTDQTAPQAPTAAVASGPSAAPVFAQAPSPAAAQASASPSAQPPSASAPSIAAQIPATNTLLPPPQPAPPQHAAATVSGPPLKVVGDWILERGYVGHVVSTPTGPLLAHLGPEEYQDGLYVENLNTGDDKKVLQNAGGYKAFDNVSFSPDGTHLVFHACPPAPGKCDNGRVYAMRTDGSGLTQISPADADGLTKTKVKSDDGLLEADTRPPGLHVRDLKTGERRQLLFDVAGQPCCGNVAFSSDSSRLIFTLQDGKGCGDNLYSVKLDGSELGRVKADDQEAASHCKTFEDASAPLYSPDGKSIMVEVSVRSRRYGSKNYVGILPANASKQNPKKVVEGTPRFWSGDSTAFYYEDSEGNLARYDLAKRQTETATGNTNGLLGVVPGMDAIFVMKNSGVDIVDLDAPNSGVATSPEIAKLAARIPVHDSSGHWLQNIQAAGANQLFLLYGEHAQLVEY